MALTAQNRCQIGERNRCHRVRVRVEIDQNDIHGGSIVAEHPPAPNPVLLAVCAKDTSE